MKKALAIVAFVLAAGVIGYWAMDGQHMANQFEVEKIEVIEDEFGDKEEKKTWVKEFHLGLMDGALPAALGLVGIGAVLLFLDVRGRKKSA